MPITEDASTPAVVHITGTADPTTASFSPPPYSLLVAIVGTGPSTNVMSGTPSDTSGALTWTTGIVQAGFTADKGGLAAVYLAYVPVAPGAITVTVALSAFGTGGGSSLALRVLNGANLDQSTSGTGAFPYGGTAQTNSEINVTTTAVGSVVYGMDDSTSINTTYTANGLTTNIDSFGDATDAAAMVAWKANAATVTPGLTRYGGNWVAAALSNIAAIEIIPAPPPIPILGRSILQAVKRSYFY